MTAEKYLSMKISGWKREVPENNNIISRCALRLRGVFCLSLIDNFTKLIYNFRKVLNKEINNGKYS